MADEATGLEDVVEPWCNAVIDSLERACRAEDEKEEEKEEVKEEEKKEEDAVTALVNETTDASSAIPMG